jgi:hypothetical protein
MNLGAFVKQQISSDFRGQFIKWNFSSANDRAFRKAKWWLWLAISFFSMIAGGYLIHIPGGYLSSIMEKNKNNFPHVLQASLEARASHSRS